MKKGILIALSLALVAGLFCFFYFRDEGELPIDPSNKIEEKEKEKKTEENRKEEDNLKREDKQEESPKQIEDKGQENKTEIEEKSAKEEIKDNINNIELEIKSADVDEKVDVLSKDLSIYGKSVLDSFSFSKGKIEFELPNTGENIHLGLSVQIFKANGEGDDLLFRYSSDDGWMKDRNEEPGKKTIALDLDESFSDLKTILQIKIFDLESGRIQIIDVLWNESNEYEIICGETRS